jgi:diguanylate cyclase (GGDEF)-like protein
VRDTDGSMLVWEEKTPIRAILRSDEEPDPEQSRSPFDLAELFAAYDAFEDAAKAVSELLRQYVGVPRWFALRRHGARWAALDMRDLSELEEADARLFADALLTSFSEATGPMLVAHLREFAPASPQTADSAGAVYLLGAPLVERGRLGGFVFGLAPAVPYSRIRRHRKLIAASVRLLNTLLERDARSRALRRWAERARARGLLDPLTGLANRRSWDQLLAKEEQRARRYGHAAMIFVIDLDGFKEINDREGHEAGDKVLQAVAAALSRAIRSTDVLARLGGDEFGVIAVESDEATGATLLARLTEALELEGTPASIGASRLDARGAAEAWREADRAMYEEKRRRAAERVLLRAGAKEIEPV